MIVQKMMVMGDWGFPMRPLDVRMLVSEFLNQKGFITRLGPDNIPGKDWMAGFVNRHPEITKRRTVLLKRSRASVGPEEVNSFFEHFSKVADGVPPENMWNYDETNFTEDPGAQDCFFRRGTKYAEKVCDASKNVISVMFCGSASGEMLPSTSSTRPPTAGLAGPKASLVPSSAPLSLGGSPSSPLRTGLGRFFCPTAAATSLARLSS